MNLNKRERHRAAAIQQAAENRALEAGLWQAHKRAGHRLPPSQDARTAGDEEPRVERVKGGWRAVSASGIVVAETKFRRDARKALEVIS